MDMDEIEAKAMKRRRREQELYLKRSLRKQQDRERDLKLYYEQLPKLKIAGEQGKQAMLNSIKQAGYVFCPSDITLIGYYLMDGGRYDTMGPIADEPNVFNKHPTDLLAGKSEACYFFTTSQPNEEQWIAGKKTDIIYQDHKIGDKQVYEYCERGHKSKYKIILYQVDPPKRPNNVGQDFHRSLCKVYEETSCADGS